MAKKKLISAPKLPNISNALYQALKSETVGEKPSISPIQIAMLAGLSVLTAVNLALIFILVVNKDRALPRQSLLGQQVGFKTKSEIATLLKEDVTFGQRTYQLTIGDKEYSFTPQEIGVGVDPEASAETTVSRGKNVGLKESLRQIYQAIAKQGETRIFLKTDKNKLDPFLVKIATETHIEPIPAKITFSNNQPQISDSAEGRQLDKLGTVAAITNAITEQRAGPIEAVFIPLGTKLTEANKAQWIRKLNQIAEHNFTIAYDNRQTVVTKEKIIDMLALENSQPEELATWSYDSKQLSVSQPLTNPSAEFKLNSKHVQSLVDRLKAEIDQDPVDARFTFDGERVNAFTSSQDGKELDGEEAKSYIAKALTAGEASVSLTVKTTKAKVSNESVNNLGIKELIGQGVSNYAGSGEGRAFNLTLGSQKLNGVLVAPGETFSLYKVLGDVESTTGYKEAYVIVNGRTQVGIGGGVCQVSTTLFRAVLNTGLPIVERHPHAYRVHYYEEGSSPGMDASVYFPDSDFRFKNDTLGYILIQTNVDARTNKLTYNIYGTKDNREVTVTTPLVSNVRPAPPALYQDDPTLPVGTVKQVDFAAIGAFATFNRTVKKDGVVVAQDRFDSSYQPWQAIYLKGTKTI